MSDFAKNPPVQIVGALSDGTATVPVNSTASGELRVAELLTQGGVQGAVVVGTTAVAARVGALNFQNRKTLTVTPTDGKIYWGYTNAVTVASGSVIYKNQQVTFSAADTLTIWLIASVACDVRITEGN